ncbi:uncharacterized protein PAC_11414 [Phialocephala subalpina]|uniref:Uncharacterized protein n=1 Tax=Phialocephala subalpina TaxID=576137 RepID=A0A1L7X952_9HELO|nr:uncharacterized protein PAC_11414 [Phialocephala subalpina]
MSRQARRQQLPLITREEVHSKEAEYNRSRHHKPVVALTTKTYYRTKALWKNFYEYIDEDKPCLQKHEHPPSPGRLKHFIEWVFETSFGVLTEHITLKSLENTWYNFCAMYFRETDVAIPQTAADDVRCFIKTELKTKGLAQIRRHKALADALDVAWLLTYLWCYDKHEFRHPRPGVIVESSAYRGSNEAMRYKDFELVGLPTGPENTLELVLKVKFRYEKNNRDQKPQTHASENVEDDEDVNDHDDKYKWVLFREDRTCCGRCPR